MRIVSGPVTWQQFLDLPDAGVRWEVVDGQPVVNPSPGGPHQRAVSRLTRLLGDACPADHEVLPAPFDWVLWRAPQLQVRQPDLVVVTHAQADSPRLTEAPLLLVEILSPDSFERDVVVKRAEYAAAGARHYWVVDLGVPEVVVYGREGDRLVQRHRAQGDEALELDEPFPVRIRARSLVR